MATTATSKSILTKWLADRKKAFKENQMKLGIYYTGESAEGIKEVSTDSSGKLIDTTGRIYHQIYGRKAGSFPPVESILAWIRAKPIPIDGGRDERSVAFLIARNIAEEGIKVPNPYNKGTLFSDTFTQESIDALKRELGVMYKEEFTTEIMKKAKE